MKKRANNLIPNFQPFIPPESIDRVVKTLKTSWIGGDGPQVKLFEKKIAQLIQNENVLATNSGTSALEISLRLAGVKGGEVITTPMTCLATNTSIVKKGAVPVWADIDPETGNIKPSEIVKKITKKTKAIMVVHWGGAPAEVDSINKIGMQYKIPVIEDAAQAFGSEYGGRAIGSHSDFVAFSFQAIKIINTIEGGALATKKATDASRGRRLRWYGVDRERRKWNKFNFWDYPVTELGNKMQMSDVNASIGLGQLPYLQKLLAHRRKLAAIYQEAINKSRHLTAQKILPKAKPNHWLFTIICDSQMTKLKLWQALKKIGVKTEEAHRRNDLYPVFKSYPTSPLPGVEIFDKLHLIIPIGYWVSISDAQKIARVLKDF